MTDYEQLAEDLGSTLADAVRLARAAWRGEAMTDREAGLVAALGGSHRRGTMASGDGTPLSRRLGRARRGTR